MKIKLLITASIFLLLGIMTYLFFYPNKFQILTMGSFQIEVYKVTIENPFFLAFIYAFTSYCHAVFMPLFSVLITQEYTDKSVYFWSFTWGVIDSCFELLQLKTISNEEISSLWIFNRFNLYFETGHFDMGDIIFIWLGVFSVIYLWRYMKDSSSSNLNDKEKRI